MNILPHKSWHVRTKQNIARVRRDEALAAEQEKERQRRVQLAESEARLKILREKAGSVEETADNEAKTSSFIQFDKSTEADGGVDHINFFKDLEDGNYKGSVSNAEYEKEKKQEREQYEKKIGYLTYLGQDTNEALGKRSWYEMAPDYRKDDGCDRNEEIDLKRKSKDDPLSIVNKALKRDGTTIKPSSKTAGSNIQNVTVKNMAELVKSKKKKKSKKKTRSRSSSSLSSTDENDDEIKNLKLLKLREERLKREREERVKAEMLFGKPKSQATSSSFGPIGKQKYNSQFNPHLARQNFQRH